VRIAIDSHRRRLPTALVNRTLRDAQDARPHPRTRAKAIRVLYGLQADVAPPTFVLFASGQLEEGYVRFLEHRIRDVEPFAGTPLSWRVKQRSRHEVER
jgi:GTP-binding protein